MPRYTVHYGTYSAITLPSGPIILLLPESIGNSGGFVTQWADLSGNGHHYDPYNGSSPSGAVVYSSTGFNSGPCVDITSLGYMRRISGTTPLTTTAFTYAAVYDLGGTGTYVMVDWADIQRTIVTASTLQYNLRISGTDTPLISTGAVSTPLRLIVTCTQGTPIARMYVNGSLVGSSSNAGMNAEITQSTGTLAQNTFGARSNGTLRSNSKLAALGLWDRDFTASGEIAALDNYLISKCGF